MSRPSAAELTERTEALRWFSFKRSFGGHAQDGDSLVVAIAYGDEAERLALCAQLDLEPASGMALLFGERVYVTFAQGRLCAYLGGPSYFLESKDLDAAERLEAAFERAGLTPEPRANAPQ